MTREFCHDLNDMVRITELEVKGRVTGLYVCDTGTQYRVRYFYGGVARHEYFYQDEICAL